MGFADLHEDARFWIVSGVSAVACFLIGFAIIGAGIEHSAAVLSPIALFIFLITLAHTRIRDQKRTI